MVKFYVARDKSGRLYAYGHRPVLIDSDQPKVFVEDESKKDSWSMKIFDNFFPEVTFENSPLEVTVSYENITTYGKDRV